MTTKLSENTRRHFISDALRRYSEDVTLVGTADPFQVRLNGKPYSIHVAPIHGASRENDDEERIQVPAALRDVQSSRQAAGITPIFVGVYPNGEAFSAWEPEYVLSLQSADVGSIYARASHEPAVAAARAAVREFNSRKLGRRTRLISLPLEDFGLYLENWPVIHKATDVSDLLAILDFARRSPLTAAGQPAPSEEIIVGGKRERITTTRTSYPRDASFRRAVLRAYDHRCAVCSRQLGLLEAAHIIPHNQEDCANSVTNGIALCVEHHRLYDDALLLPACDGKLYLNGDRVEHLENINQTAGLKEVRDLAAKGYRLPNDSSHHPDPNYLARGLRLRLAKGE